MSAAAKNGTTVLWWPGKLLSEDDLRRHWTSQGELVLGSRTIVTPLAWDWLRARHVQVRREVTDTVPASAGAPNAAWGIAEETPSEVVAAAIKALTLEGRSLTRLAGRTGPLAPWIRSFARAVAAGDPAALCLFCQEPALAACLANKVTGVRAVTVAAAAQLGSLQKTLGPNFYAIAAAGRTYFELRQLLQRITAVTPSCPPDLATTLTELEHAHR